MRKKLLTMAASGLMALSMAFTSFAGAWEEVGSDWKYKNDDSTYASGWQWVDGKSYYFGADGIMAKDTTVDGYTVNSDGQWVVDGVVQTQETQNNQIANTTGVQHSANYDPEHPLAHKVDEWNLRLPRTLLGGFYAGGSHNVQALLTNQMDQFYIAPVTDPIWTKEEDYYEAVNTTQQVYEWFKNWLNSMDWENMSEMEKAHEIKKVLGECTYDMDNYLNSSSIYNVLINRKGDCSGFALTATSLAKTVGLKSSISGTGTHAVYYIQVDGTTYMGNNQILELDWPSPDYVVGWD